MAVALSTLFSKVGAITGATRAKATEVVLAAQAAGKTVVFLWGYDSRVVNVEHHSGRAIDFMVGNSRSNAASKAAGDFVFAFLWKHRARLRVRHIIWRQSVISTVVSPGVRRSMADRGNDTANHYDHVHVWFLDDGYAKLPPAKPPIKPPIKPPAKPRVVLAQGSRGKRVAALQRGLMDQFELYAGPIREHGGADGVYGPATATVVREFQRRTGLPRTGTVDVVTQAKLARYHITF